MTHRYFLHALPLLLLGCAPDDKVADTGAAAAAGDDDPLQGIWLLQVPWADPADAACSEGLDHNFPGAYRPGDGPWSETDTADRSDALYFVQIERMGDDEAVMLLGRDILLGTAGDQGWTFSWAESDDTLHIEEHEDGYAYREERMSLSTVTLDLGFSGATASGTWSGTTDIERVWEESDEWIATVGRELGEIPVADYLVYDDGGAEGIPESNLRTEADCEGARCSLGWVQSCDGSSTVSLRRTTHEDEGIYDLLEEVVQPFGGGM